MRLFSAIILWIAWLALLYSVCSFVLISAIGPRASESVHPIGPVSFFVAGGLTLFLIEIGLFLLRRSLYGPQSILTVARFPGMLLYLTLSLGAAVAAWGSSGVFFLPGVINRLPVLMILSAIIGIISLLFCFPKMPKARQGGKESD